MVDIWLETYLLIQKFDMYTFFQILPKYDNWLSKVDFFQKCLD